MPLRNVLLALLVPACFGARFAMAKRRYRLPFCSAQNGLALWTGRNENALLRAARAT